METAQLIELPATEPFQAKCQFKDKELARLAGIKSGEVRRAKKNNPTIKLAGPVSEPVPHQTKLTVLEKQIKRVDELIAIAQNAKDFLALTQSKDRLLRNFCYLANIAGPGTRKPKPEPSTRSTSTCTPSDESNGV